jgi:hypothetical protein
MPSVFLSYAREDERTSSSIASGLRSCGWDVWVDTSGIRGAAEFASEIELAIGNADAFLFVLSLDSAASPWCRREIDAAADLGRPIVVAELEDVRLPPALQFLTRGRQRLIVSQPMDDDFDRDVQRLDDSLLRAIEESVRMQPDRRRMVLGKVLGVVGVLGILGAMVGFGVLMATSDGSDGEAARFVIVLGAFFLSGVVAAIGSGIQRSARVRGIEAAIRRGSR